MNKVENSSKLTRKIQGRRKFSVFIIDFKACVRSVYQIFIFYQMIAL